MLPSAPVMPEVYGLRLLMKPTVRRSILLVLIAVVIGFRLVQFANLTGDPRWALDFSYYWTAGLRVLHGESIYSIQQLHGTYIPEGQDGFLYPPPLAVLVAPLAALFPTDYGQAGWIWMVVGAALLVLSVVAVARSEGLDRQIGGLPGSGVVYLVIAALVLPPVMGELTVGNVHFEILGLLSLAWLGIRRGSPGGDAVAGVAIAAAALIKVFPALLVLWLLATGRWRAAMWSLVGGLALALAVLPWTGIQSWLDYPKVLANMGAILDIHDSVSPTLWLAPVLGFDVARWTVAIAGVFLITIVARTRPTALSYGFAVGASVVVAPAVFHHYLSIFILPMLLAMSGGLRFSLIAAGYLLLWGGQQPGLGEWDWILSRVPQTLGWVLLLGLLAVGRVHLPRTHEDLATAPAAG